MCRYIKVHILLATNTGVSLVVTLSLFIYNIIKKFTVTTSDFTFSILFFLS